MPGHGTATLAPLAGAKLDVSFGGQQFSSEFGGAPDAEVHLPICDPSVRQYDFISISHGGLPSPSWADAVNMLYEDEIAIVAASGDSIRWSTSLCASPSTWRSAPPGRTYITDKIGTMRLREPGCGSGVSHRRLHPQRGLVGFDHPPNGSSMSGGGTSSRTSQIAVACALWLDCYGNQLPKGWQRSEACRAALFERAQSRHADMPKLGWGMLDAANKILNAELVAKILADSKANKLTMSPVDPVSFPFWLVDATPVE